MTTDKWVPIVAALVGGGAMGAVITAVVTSFRNRIQPVGHRIEVSPVLQPASSRSDVDYSLTINDQGRDFKFSNLHIAELQIANKGNRDFASFRFGITLSDSDQGILAASKSSDRHHMVEMDHVPSPSFPQKTIDFTLTPFNRRDTYTVTVYVVAPDSQDPSDIDVTTPEAVRLVPLKSFSELAAEIGPGIVIGGIRISLPFR